MCVWLMRRGAQTLSNLSFLATRTTAEMVSPKKLKVLKVGGGFGGRGFVGDWWCMGKRDGNFLGKSRHGWGLWWDGVGMVRIFGGRGEGWVGDLVGCGRYVREICLDEVRKGGEIDRMRYCKYGW